MGFFHHGPGCDDDGCSATPRTSSSGSALMTLGTLVSLAPFAATFAFVFLFVSRRVFPRLELVQQQADDGADHVLPPSAPVALRQAHLAHGAQSRRRRIAAAAFASTTALAAVLAELILAEIAALVDPAARSLALHVTVPALLGLLVVVIPFLELQSILAGSGWSLQRRAGGRFPRGAWALQLLAFGTWLLLFWSVGRAGPGMTAAERAASSSSSSSSSSSPSTTRTLVRACLERIGITGISLMGLLSGFASVSSPWETFGQRRTGGGSGGTQRRRAITDADVERKEASLMVTNDLLLTKRHRLQSLRRKVEAAEAAAAAVAAGGGETALPSTNGRSGGSSMLGKLVGSLKDMVGGSSPEAAEMKSLEVEIAGLETMAAGLSAAVDQLRARRTAEARAGTAAGRVVAVWDAVFGVYCIWRVVATTVAMVRRAWTPDVVAAATTATTTATTTTTSTSDPVSRVLGLLAEHWDPSLDRGAWARQMSFLVSGVLLAASANSVRQTCQLFARWTPRGLLYQAQANLALVVGQMAATYVISAALLLRANLPQEMGSAVGDALDSALEPRFVERWFEGWFLVAVGATALGIWIGRSLAGGDLDGWDEYGMEEMGQKRS